MTVAHPFIRWAGGKTWLTEYVHELISGIEFQNYYEPFLGGGAVFFSVDTPNPSFLSDLNDELVNSYIQVRDYPEMVVKQMKEFKNIEDDYYRIREIEFVDPIQKAARFIYLNYTSYNGLYRVNREGKYNVPYGHRAIEYDYQKIYLASEKLKNAFIASGDFEMHKKRINKNDLVFLDPPYSVSDVLKENGFVQYNQKLFPLEEQKRLSGFVSHIKDVGAYYILTNTAHETIRQIFDKGDRIISLERNSLIGGRNAKRGIITEYIFTNIPEKR